MWKIPFCEFCVTQRKLLEEEKLPYLNITSKEDPEKCRVFNVSFTLDTKWQLC
jgi:hypothetical protein